MMDALLRSASEDSKLELVDEIRHDFWEFPIQISNAKPSWSYDIVVFEGGKSFWN